MDRSVWCLACVALCGACSAQVDSRPSAALRESAGGSGGVPKSTGVFGGTNASGGVGTGAGGNGAGGKFSAPSIGGASSASGGIAAVATGGSLGSGGGNIGGVTNSGGSASVGGAQGTGGANTSGGATGGGACDAYCTLWFGRSGCAMSESTLGIFTGTPGCLQKCAQFNEGQLLCRAQELTGAADTADEGDKDLLCRHAVGHGVENLPADRMAQCGGIPVDQL